MPHVKYRSPSIAPAYTGRLATNPIRSLRLPDDAMEPTAAYRFIHWLPCCRQLGRTDS